MIALPAPEQCIFTRPPGLAMARIIRRLSTCAMQIASPSSAT